MLSKLDIVLYHANCADGFSSAWAIAQSSAAKPETKYIPVQYNNPVPEFDEGLNVAIVDFSYSKRELTALKLWCKELIVLDHHKTAFEALQDLSYAIFDMQRSGAVITWEYFNSKRVPLLLQYVQDRDLWAWKLAHSKEINAVVSSTPKTFEEWTALATTLEEDFDCVVNAGMGIQSHIDLLSLTAAQKFVVSNELLGYPVKVATANITQYISETSHMVLKINPDVDVSASYFMQDNKQIWSLRSRFGGVDVSAIAKHFNGGGHQNAAGFTVDKDSLIALDTSIAEKVFNKLISYQLALIDDLPCKAETLLSEAIVVLSSVCLQECLDNLDETKANILKDAQQIFTSSTQIVQLS